MTVQLLVACIVALFLVLLIIRIPVAFALAMSGGIGLLALQGFDAASLSVGNVPFAAVAKIALAVIPMFIMMGMFAQTAGLPEQLFKIANAKLGKLPGGLAIATIATGAGFGAVTGSSVATAATVGRMSIGQMLNYGYSKPMAAGVVAAAGTLGVMIPPSVILVLYGVVTGESIGALLMAGIVPGLLSAVVMGTFVLLRAKFNPAKVYTEEGLRARVAQAELAGLPKVSLSDAAVLKPGSDAPTAQEKLPWRGLVWILIIFGVVLGGIYGGVFTATEAGAAGALLAALIMVWELRKTGFRGVLRGFATSFRETASTSSMMLAVVLGAALFTAFLVRAGVVADFTAWVVSLDVPPLLLIALLILALIPLGTVLESFSLILIAAPLIYPVAIELGFDGIWIGILIVKAVEIGLITPPVGMNVYVVAGTTKGLTVEDTFRGVTPFFFVEIFVTALIFLIPAIALWLPSTMMN